MALRPCLFLICWLSKTDKNTAYDRFHGNDPYGKIPTKKEPIRKLGFTSRLSCHIINYFIPNI